MRRRLGIFLSLVGLGCFPTWFSAFSETPKCVQIYYDRIPAEIPSYPLGRIHAQMLQNLLGHFPQVKQWIKPIEEYQPGEVEKCFSSIYLGTYYPAKIPDAFISDFIHTKRNVVWAGYNIWKIPSEDLKKLWGVEFEGLAKLDYVQRDEKGRPGFFKEHEYLGETFTKYGEFDPVKKETFMAYFEISLLRLVTEDARNNVVSWAKHSTQKDLKTPYLLRKNNHWYFADSPFYFATENDRYLILADVLFDILDEKPIRNGSKPLAVFRLEDVHPKLLLWQLYRMVDLLAQHQIPFSLTVIPIFSDPLGVSQKKVADRFVSMNEKKEFVEFLKYAKGKGASFILHGLTHQYGKKPNPFTAMTGDDFEFWDRVNNRPIDKDSVDFVLTRLEEARQLMAEAGIEPSGWLPPHYQASPLDCIIFSEVFNWNMGRMIYFPFRTLGREHVPAELALDGAYQASDAPRRKAFFNKMKVEVPEGLLPAGQFYPYEIYGDSYGQRIIPENVGNVQPYLNEQVLRTLTVEQMVETIKRNRKMRDVWASYFIHPFLLDDRSQEGLAKFAGDVEEIEKLITETQKAGYEFVSLRDWVKSAQTERAQSTWENGGPNGLL